MVNARDAGDGGDDHIIVTTEVVDGCARLSVSDTGVGMTTEVASRAFEPFFSTKSSSGGTGLGLAIVYGIANRMGGTVHIDSTPGRGTTVVVSLPCATTVAPATVHDGAATLGGHVRSWGNHPPGGG